MNITDDEKWQAVKDNDKKFDNTFFYAVKSTRIFCKPSCRSKLPKRENVLYFETIESAQEAGYRSCKRCRSELLAYEPKRIIAKQVKAIFDNHFRESNMVADALQELNLSQRRINDLFKAEYGLSPKIYIGNLRLEEAKRLLIETDDDILNIAYCVGFKSLSVFYSFFKEQTGITPKNYRKENKK